MGQRWDTLRASWYSAKAWDAHAGSGSRVVLGPLRFNVELTLDDGRGSWTVASDALGSRQNTGRTWSLRWTRGVAIGFGAEADGSLVSTLVEDQLWSLATGWVIWGLGRSSNMDLLLATCATQ